MDDKISIILPTYMAEKTIYKAIKSVLNQTYKNIELIIIENGPKGKVEDNLKHFKIDRKQEIKYIYSKVANVSKARNIGIENASGKYLAFIDSDDCYEKDFLEKMIFRLKKSDLQLVTCGYKTIYTKENFLIEESSEIEETTDLKKYLEVLKENYLFNELWSKLYLNSIVQKNSIRLNENYELGEDFIFNLDYIEHISKAGYINEPLYIYTDGQEGLKLRYREDKYEIEYSLTKYLENYYKKNNYSMEYIYNRLARVYYNAILNIYADNNPEPKNKKDKKLSELIKSDNFVKDLNFIKNKITDQKFKIVVKYFFLRGIFMIKIFIVLSKFRRKWIH